MTKRFRIFKVGNQYKVYRRFLWVLWVEVGELSYFPTIECAESWIIDRYSKPVLEKQVVIE